MLSEIVFDSPNNDGFPRYLRCKSLPDGRTYYQRFTGLMDRHGTPIYEGDFVAFWQRGYTHGPEPEMWDNQVVWYDPAHAVFLFGREAELSMFDGVAIETLQVVDPHIEHELPPPPKWGG